jgi:hypothetical protein
VIPSDLEALKNLKDEFPGLDGALVVVEEP